MANDNKIHEPFMHRCLQLALLGQGYVAPNPMVGAVLVNEGKIIGEGYHRQIGGHHAEVEAIISVEDKSLLPASTLYVSLEPCNHFGKTPPCTHLILEQKIPKVVYGMRDNSSKEGMKGEEYLREKGVDVTGGILVNECEALNKRFFTFHSKKRPYIILKWAQTADGFMAPPPAKSAEEGHPHWISNMYSRKLVHKWRTEEHAIIVGTTTAMLDNPQLTARDWKGPSPLRIVIDRELRLPRQLNLFDASAPTLVFTAKEAPQSSNPEYISIEEKESFLKEVLNELHSREVLSLIVEGGKTLLEMFIEQNAWDEARVFIAPSFMYNGIKAPSPVAPAQLIYEIAGDRLYYFMNGKTA
ncbi:MAG: bifunctional diaminohydroxyphosphoribosylaminopyrimidine deaminase/5-amino-6-(5-phosphoribosylamino)uracil reductase RibD [Bacteroidia bacterium]